MRRDGPMKFEEDFDFETANAQFHKDEIDKELQNKLKLKGTNVCLQQRDDDTNIQNAPGPQHDGSLTAC